MPPPELPSTGFDSDLKTYHDDRNVKTNYRDNREMANELQWRTGSKKKKKKKKSMLYKYRVGSQTCGSVQS